MRHLAIKPAIVVTVVLTAKSYIYVRETRIYFFKPLFSNLNAIRLEEKASSLPFARTALAFHTTTGESFTVSYTVDAQAKTATTGSNNTKAQ